MTIDMENFEMTLEVLGDGDEAGQFFESYEKETRRDLESMREYIKSKDWLNLKRLCHTWKGRNSQIGFRKSAHIASSLHDFLQHTGSEDINGDNSGSGSGSELVQRQVEVFFGTLEGECEKITAFLKSQYLL